MITTSTGYKNAVVKNGRTWKAKVVINGAEYTEFSRFEYVNTIISESHITIGEAVTSTLDFTLDTTDTIFKEGRSFEAYIGLVLENQTIEWVKIGVFHITKPEKDDTALKVTAQDNMCLTTKGFFTNLSGNQKISSILTEQCNKLGFSYAGGADDVSVNVSLLSGYTVREVFGILASYCGKNATIDRDGNLKFSWFSDVDLNVGADKFQDPLTLAEEDTFINKLTCVINNEEQVDTGVGIGISFSNPLMTVNRLSVLYGKIKGFTYRPCTVNMILGRPDLEVGDVITVTDKRGNTYKVPIMSQGISFDGGVSCKFESKGKTEIEQETEVRGNLTTRVDRTVSDLTITKKLLADTIEAYNGEFETINTNYLEVNKKLTALDAEIENLDVTELTAKVAIIETSYVSKEYVQDLYATKAEVHVLDVDLERVNTLLAGSVTAGSTQTIVLNADNTTISNALIKSAMIDSVAADKVTAGTIDASSIHFKSQSGRLDIYGETLQIKDITRPRVQIGKDASGDYNMYVWDAAGKLMFDAAGITASGIQRPIIVDSMVADNANISGDKINITSLVKEINDGTEVIKSSHILVDGANQSLSVVYNTIKGDISTLSTTLSVEQGKVSSLITDVSQAKGDVSTLQTNYSSLTQTVNGINSTVSSHTSSIENLNNMEIGGRNLITNTRPDKATVYSITSKWSAQIVDETTAISGKATQATCTAAGAQGFYHHISRRLEPGKKYTWSIYVKTSKNSRISLGSEQGGLVYCDITDGWKRFTHTFTANGDTHYQFTFFASSIWAVGDIIWYHSLILVEGDKAPTWMPAPEDVDASIKTVSDKTSTLEQTVNGFSGRISSIETTANNASSKVTEITATVNGLTTTVANKTDKGAIISTINQSAEAIKIQASKLELTGYVTMTNLSTSGQTSIDGGNIKTRTITAAKIASGTITATQIAANTITGAKIASETITADKISVTSLSALTANLGTVTAGSLTSNTTISVSTNLTVGNNIYLNQNVNTTKYIYFNSSNYIRNLYTNSYNYITVNSNYRCALMSGSTSVYAYGNTGEAGISAAASIIFSSYGNGRLEHYGKYYDANWSSGFFRPLQAGTALGGSGASYRWYRLYAANTCSTSSDIRLKTNVKKYDVRYESMYMDLKPVTYELISTPGKTQCGLIAQWVKEAMDKNGISENEFALYEHDIREDSYSISYEQLTSLNMHMVQKTIKRVDAIDDELLSIKASRQQDAQELQQELQKRDFEISQLQYRIQQLESRS